MQPGGGRQWQAEGLIIIAAHVSDTVNDKHADRFWPWSIWKSTDPAVGMPGAVLADTPAITPRPTSRSARIPCLVADRIR